MVERIRRFEMKIIEILKVIGASLGFLFLVCLPGLVEWACKPIPTWVLSTIIVAMVISGCIILIRKMIRNK